jgi:hypothetical protein
MDRSEQVFARGVSPSGDAWILGWQADKHAGITWLRVTTPAGRTHKGGYGSPSISPHSPVSMYTGSADHVPNGAILRVASGATSLEFTTSDGITQTLDLHPHPAHEGARVAALVYPRGTNIVSVRVVDPRSAHDVSVTERHQV